MRLPLLPVRSVRVSGVVADSSGAPLTGVFVSADVPMGAGAMALKRAAVMPDGTFRLPVWRRATTSFV